MNHHVVVCLALLGFVGCTAPQGQKISSTGGDGLAPVALGPATEISALTLQNEGENVRMRPDGTITVTLPAAYRQGYMWRFAEIPDPSVLKLVSKEFTPSPTPDKPGEQVMVFQATGLGDVPVKLRYGSLWASSEMGATKPFQFIASVAAVPEKKPAKKPARKKKKATT